MCGGEKNIFRPILNSVWLVEGRQPMATGTDGISMGQLLGSFVGLTYVFPTIKLLVPRQSIAQTTSFSLKLEHAGGMDDATEQRRV